MRARLLRVLLVGAAIVAVGLSACTSSPRRTPEYLVQRLLGRAPSQPPPIPTPGVRDRACARAVSERHDELARALVRRLDDVEPGTFGPLNNVVTAAINEVGITTSGTAVGSMTGPPGVRLLHVGWCGNFGGVDAFVREVDGGTWHVASSDLAAPLSAQWVDGTWLIRQNTQGIMQTVRLWVIEYENGDWVTTYEAQHSGLALDGVYHPPKQNTSSRAACITCAWNMSARTVRRSGGCTSCSPAATCWSKTTGWRRPTDAHGIRASV